VEQQKKENAYLGQVLQNQVRVDQELRRRKSAPAAGPQAPMRRRGLGGPPGAGSGGPRAVDYRITGFWRWCTVVVPPNVYVVHTRRGRRAPLHMGLGISFRFDPVTDAFLVIPATMQTIIINANCICIERQGILVQAYVQWIIDDLAVAYRRLDFSDAEDPTRIVNIQLSEQAEAAIKDKVSTMHIDEVLADKQSIIEELTHRLRTVVEGRKEEGSGLGLKIVTVQIKEAVVSSTSLWENLQAPFRSERDRVARLAELSNRREVTAQELEVRRRQETATITVEAELAALRAAQEASGFDRQIVERTRRHELEQAAIQREIAEENATEQARQEAATALALKEIALAQERLHHELTRAQSELERVRAQSALDTAAEAARLELVEMRSQSAQLQGERDVALARQHRAVDNDVSAELLRSRLIGALPELAEKLPAPAELRTVSIGPEVGPAGPLLALLTSALEILEGRAAGRSSPAQASAGHQPSPGHQ